MTDPAITLVIPIVDHGDGTATAHLPMLDDSIKPLTRPADADGTFTGLQTLAMQELRDEYGERIEVNWRRM
jgi:hypothetical protein